MGVDPSVVVIDRDCEGPFRLFLADDVLVEDVFYLFGRRAGNGLTWRLADLFFREDLVTERNALVADVYTGSRDEFLYTFFGLSAEAAVEVCVCHGRFPFP